MYSNFMLIDQLLFELSYKNTETGKRRNTETHTDSDEYFIVAFCKNSTITRKRFSEKPIVAFTNSTVLNFILDFYMYD